MRLVVGLGNPDLQYRETPHNAGFQVCDRFAELHRMQGEVRKFQGLFRRGRVLGQDVGVLKPMTYMNLSGDAVAEALRYLPVETKDLVIVWDEIDLPQGKVRIRPHGGHGGHNGVRSIIARTGQSDFPRIRVGVGRPASGRNPTGHLLSRVPPAERARFRETIDLAVEALGVLLTLGAAEAMNRYNGRPAVG